MPARGAGKGDVPVRTIVRDLMSSPPVTCDAGTALADAARRMRRAEIGSIVVVERGKVTGS